MTALLVVDWDYFFRPPPGWWDDVRETDHYRYRAWRNRTPHVQTTGWEHAFWPRFAIRPDATLYVADSNAFAADPRVVGRVPDQIWLFDAHHDAGYRQDLAMFMRSREYDCGDWLLDYVGTYGVRQRNIHIRYPAWRTCTREADTPALRRVDVDIDDATAYVPIVFGTVFVCRSGAWTPPWLDNGFHSFVARSGVKRVVNLDGVRVRAYSRVDAEEEGSNVG